MSSRVASNLFLILLKLKEDNYYESGNFSTSSTSKYALILVAVNLQKNVFIIWQTSILFIMIVSEIFNLGVVHKWRNCLMGWRCEVYCNNRTKALVFKCVTLGEEFQKL